MSLPTLTCSPEDPIHLTSLAAAIMADMADALERHDQGVRFPEAWQVTESEHPECYYRAALRVATCLAMLGRIGPEELRLHAFMATVMLNSVD